MSEADKWKARYFIVGDELHVSRQWKRRWKLVAKKRRRRMGYVAEEVAALKRERDEALAERERDRYALCAAVADKNEARAEAEKVRLERDVAEQSKVMFRKQLHDERSAAIAFEDQLAALRARHDELRRLASALVQAIDNGVDVVRLEPRRAGRLDAETAAREALEAVRAALAEGRGEGEG